MTEGKLLTENSVVTSSFLQILRGQVQKSTVSSFWRFGDSLACCRYLSSSLLQLSLCGSQSVSPCSPPGIRKCVSVSPCWYQKFLLY